VSAIFSEPNIEHFEPLLFITTYHSENMRIEISYISREALPRYYYEKLPIPEYNPADRFSESEYLADHKIILAGITNP